MKFFDKNSMKVKISFIVMFVIIIEAVLLLGSLLLSDGATALKNNPYISFSKDTDIHTSYIKDEMKLDIGNISDFAYNMVEVYDNMLQSDEQLTTDDARVFLKTVAPDIIDMLNTAVATGAFLFLVNEEETQPYDSIYFLDVAPRVVNHLNEDMLLFRGDTEIANVFSPTLKMDPRWKQDVTLMPETQDIVNMPIQRYKQHKNVKELGYWDVSFGMSYKDMSILTYSLPLIDKNNKVFGILGMAISDVSLNKVLPHSEFGKEYLLGHMLGRIDKEPKEIIPVLNFDIAKKYKTSPLGTPLQLTAIDDELNLYQVDNANADFPVLASVYPLGLYENTPFADEEWVLIGLADRNKLDAESTNFMTSLYTIFFIILISGAILVYLVAIKLTRPIVVLANNVETNDIKTILSLSKTKTGYSEVDTLARAIEQFHRKELYASSKTDRIIRMVNLPLGTFEYNKDNDSVDCSETFFKLMGISASEITENTISHALFSQKIATLKENTEDEYNNVYRLDNNKKKWVKLVEVEHENIVLGICMDVTAEILKNRLIKYERDYDRLTHLLNRFSFKLKVEKLFRGEIKDVAALIIFDLDNLKYINDTYGHSSGDFYIKSVAQILSNLVQEPCVIGRIAGDEFYIFLHGFESRNAIRKNIASIYEEFNQNYIRLRDGSMFKLRMSGGIAWYGQDSTRLEELVQFADFAMYQGKKTVKGELREFNKEVYKNESFMLSGKEELNNVLDNQLVDYVFQVIISAKTGEIYGYESLMRPQSEILDTPLKLLRIATAQSQLWQVERITILKSLAIYREYNALFNDCKIFINSVPNESLSDAECESIEAAYPNILKNIVVEITEDEKLDNAVLARKRRYVKKWGAALALDDYGSGYNGDISLLTIRPQIVKIDREMITGIETDKSRQSIIHKLMEYSRGEGIIVLAEGVETFSQMDYLVRAGVDLLQGYYVARPRKLPDYNPDAISKEILDIHNSLKNK